MQRNAIIGAVIGASLAAGSGFLVGEAWDSFGWTTPEDHDHDIESAISGISEATEAIKTFEKKWECDEALEEMSELASKPSLDGDQATYLGQLAEKVDEDDCHRFQ